MINIYGEQESRVTQNDIENRWIRIFNEIAKIENRSESCIIVGDLNKHIGCDELGVRNNHPKVTFGGELVRALLADGNYICLNNHPNAKGGAFTRVDPAFPHSKSCLDLVIISRNLLKYFLSITIDSDRKFSPVRPINKKESRYSDHFPIIVEFKNIPLREQAKPFRNSHTIWNTKKQGGWEAFKTSTDKKDTFIDVFNDQKTTTEVARDIDKKVNKLKFSAFGKIKVKSKNVDIELKKLKPVLR